MGKIGGGKLVKTRPDIGQQEVAARGPMANHNGTNHLIVAQGDIGVVNEAAVEDVRDRIGYSTA